MNQIVANVKNRFGWQAVRFFLMKALTSAVLTFIVFHFCVVAVVNYFIALFQMKAILFVGISHLFGMPLTSTALLVIISYTITLPNHNTNPGNNKIFTHKL